MELKPTAKTHLKQVLHETHSLLQTSLHKHFQCSCKSSERSENKFPLGGQSAPLTLGIPGQRVKISQQAFERQIMHFINTV